VTTRADRARATSLALAAATIWLLTGCGATTKTVTVSSVPPAHAPPTGTQATTPAQPSVGSTSTSPSASPGSTGTTTSSTRTAAEPQFEQSEGKAPAETPAALAGPLAVLHARGYAPVDTSQYRPEQTLQVLVGTRAGADGAKEEQAFFFVDGHYVGTDAAQPSGQISLVSQGDTEATLAYGLYRPGDPPCCPSGGQARVRFQLNDGQLGATGAIPAASSTGELSRR
jgi:LppP/LprE lipoprotein